MFKKKTFILLILLVLVALLMGRWFQTGFRSQVDSAVVKIDTAIDAVPAIINVRSDYTFTLSSEEGGRVASSELVLGASIQAQETVLQIDPQDLELDIRILKAEIKNLESRLQLKAQDAANLSKKEEDLANYERLFKAGSYPELEIQRRRRDFAVFKEALALKELNEAAIKFDAGPSRTPRAASGKNDDSGSQRWHRHHYLRLSRRIGQPRFLAGGSL